jgi:hypothetical protein
MASGCRTGAGALPREERELMMASNTVQPLRLARLALGWALPLTSR